MTDQQLAQKALKYANPEYPLRVVVSWSHSFRMPYEVRITCDKQVFPSEVVRGGLSTDVWVGNCRTRNLAERRATKVLKSLQRAVKETR
jgi:hypothetical protein